MDSFKLFYSVLFLTALLALTSCSDNDGTDDPITSSFVGEWNVDKGEATAYIDGYKVEDLIIETRGTITYLSDGQGVASFLMEFEGESNRIDGTFEWVDLGFEVVWNDGDREEEIRWVVDVDEPNLKVMTFTYELEEDGTDELEITATLSRIK